MSTTRAGLALLGLTTLLAIAVPPPTLAQARAAKAPSKLDQVLVFTRTETFRHSSIDDAVAAVQRLGSQNGFRIERTENPAAFTDRNLRRYDVVMFVLTTGDVLDPPQEQALERYMRRGGGYAGVHSAADTEHDWSFYGRLVGAYFRVHPLIYTPAMFTNEAHRNASTRHLPRQFGVTDEHYSFDHSPRGEVKVLLSIDENSYMVNPNTSILNGQVSDGHMGDHPMAWCHRNVGGPSWYTAIGHSDTLYSKTFYLKHLLGGIRIAAGVVKAPCGSGRN